MVTVHDYPALLRAPRRRERWSEEDVSTCATADGEAKTWHGLARAVRRGLQNMRIQSYLTAAAFNLKRLATALLDLIRILFDLADPYYILSEHCTSRPIEPADCAYEAHPGRSMSDELSSTATPCINYSGGTHGSAPTGRTKHPSMEETRRAAGHQVFRLIQALFAEMHPWP